MFLNQYILLLINVFFIFVINGENDLNFVEIDDKNNLFDEKSKYLFENNVNFSEKWNKFYKLIETERQNYNKIKKNDSKDKSCECYLNFLSQDLDYWNRTGISRDVIEEAIRQKRGIHYQIINHKLYREKDCLFPSRCEGVQHFILKGIHRFSDMDLIINVRDYPQVHKNWHKSPVLSFSKDITQYNDILYPAWTFWCGGPAIDRYPVGIGRWDLMRERIKKNSVQWNEKSLIGFFRGSRTSSDRDPIILLSRSKPHLIDAQYTANQAWRSVADTLGAQPAQTVSFEDQCQYKYLLNVRGVSASFRYKHLFLCQSVVLNADSNWIEFFYPSLKPWIHFVPIDKDLNDFEEKLTFLKENDEISHSIAKQGFDFIWNHLTLDSVQCYWNELLDRYSKLLKYTPKLDKNLIEIKSEKS